MTRPTEPNQPEPVFEQRFERPRGVLLAPVAVAVTIALWVGAVQIGGAPTATPMPLASVPVAAVSPGASSTPSARRTPPPLLQLFGAPLEGRLLIRDKALRHVDLATGLRGEPIGATGYLDRVLSLPDGRFVCLCVRQRTVGEDRRIEVTAELLDRDGEQVFETPVGSWTAADQAGLYDDGGPFLMDAAHDPSGRLVALTVGVRRPPEWQRSVVVIDLAAARVVGSISLPGTPSAEAGLGPPLPAGASPRPTEPRGAWPPSARFSPDGRRLLMFAPELEADGSPGDHRTWVAELDDGVPELLELERATGSGGDPCLDAFPEFGAPDIVSTVCWGDVLVGPFVRRVRVDGSLLPDVSLRAALKDAASPYQLIDGRGNLWLWDPWTWRVVRVDVARGAVEEIRSLGDRGVQARLVDPAMALTADGSRLVVAAADHGEAGLTGTRVLVLDASSLDRVRELDVGPDIVSLGLSDDGSLIHVGHAPPMGAGGLPQGEARLSVFDLPGGTLRAVFGRIGGTGFTIVDPAGQGG